MLNTITIMGRLTADPDLKQTQGGQPVARFTLAVERDFAPAGKEKETDFLDCVAFGKTAEFVQKFFAKGRMACVLGRLQIESWQDNNGTNRKAAKIVANNIYFADSIKAQAQPAGQPPQPAQPQADFGSGFYLVDDDDMPF